MDTYKTALWEYSQLQRQRQRLLSQLAGLPSGRLRIEKNGTRRKWFKVDTYADSSQRTIYIPKSDRHTAEQLALKKYLEDQLALLEEKLQVLKSFMDAWPPSAYSAPMPEKGISELLSPSLLKESQQTIEWISEEYEKCLDHPEALKIPTKSGLYVRSKSEGLIADTLYENHIPFRYEQALQLGGMKLYPDFTILHPGSLAEIFLRETSQRDIAQRDIIIWEHFGLMDSAGYANNAKLKLSAYLDAHFIPGQNLILTFETRDKPLDSAYVAFLIRYHFS